jgi:hypothetical protein
MKKSISILFVLLFITSFAAYLKTNLTVTVLDELGNSVAGAEINIYSNRENWEKEENPILQGTTDEKGIVKFKDLSQLNIYILVRKDDKDNTGGGEMTKLEDGKFNKIRVVIQ